MLDPEKRRASKRRYAQSERGRASDLKYMQSEKYRATIRKYERTEKRKDTRRKYKQSDKYRATSRKYGLSEKKLNNDWKCKIRSKFGGKLPDAELLEMMRLALEFRRYVRKMKKQGLTV